MRTAVPGIVESSEEELDFRKTLGNHVRSQSCLLRVLVSTVLSSCRVIVAGRFGALAAYRIELDSSSTCALDVIAPAVVRHVQCCQWVDATTRSLWYKLRVSAQGCLDRTSSHEWPYFPPLVL